METIYDLWCDVIEQFQPCNARFLSHLVSDNGPYNHQYLESRPPTEGETFYVAYYILHIIYQRPFDNAIGVR